MIVAERKPIPEIMANLALTRRLLVVGCNTCVAVCLAGGEKEVAVLSAVLRLALKQNQPELVIDERTVERQCEFEMNAALTDEIGNYDAVLSTACGVGVQTLAEQFPDAIVLPALNTKFMGRPEELGTGQNAVWVETAYLTGSGVSSVTRRSKNLLNGPCGGSSNGRCEVDPENTPVRGS